MVNALLRLLSVLRSAWLTELAGAGLVVYAVWLAWGIAATCAAAGAALLLKSLELDLRSRSDQ